MKHAQTIWAHHTQKGQKTSKATMQAGACGVCAGAIAWHRGGCAQETTDPPGDFAGDGLSRKTNRDK